jgi:hypothetical protein
MQVLSITTLNVGIEKVKELDLGLMITRKGFRMLTITKQLNRKFTVEFTGFSNRTGQQERFYCIENVTSDLLEKFMDRAGIKEPEIQFAIDSLEYLNLPVRFDEFGGLKGVVNQ